MSRRARAISGIKPTGAPHLGNYLGMIRPAIALQDTYDAYYFIADYHALTTEHDPAQLRRHSYELCATFLAFGLDPARSTFFRQSDVPEVLELSWMLACVTNMGLLERAHAYKAAVDKGDANLLPSGTFFYPVLMAADILVYDAAVVPVGKDQVQHIEMTQDMAGHFNTRYGGGLLQRPEALVRADVQTVVGTDGRKMSKSYGNAIDVFAPEKQLEKSIRRIVTDSRPPEEAKDPDGDTIFALYRLFATPAEIDALAARYRAGGMGYGHAKEELIAVIKRELAPARERYAALVADEAGLDAVLRDGAARARTAARDVLRRIRAKTGLPALADG